MSLRGFLEQVGTTYVRSSGTGQPAARLLRSAPETFGPHVPASYLIKGSAGNGGAAFCPWVAFFDPDETNTATRGMYVVYLFAENMETVALSLNQGVTELRDTFGGPRAESLLVTEAKAIRDGLEPASRTGLDAAIDLGGRAGLPRSYEAGNLLARTYKMTDLPSDAELRQDLKQFIALYQDALTVREKLRRTTRDVITTVQKEPEEPENNPLLHFAPKNDAEYTQVVTARTLKKTRKHETLVKRYGEYLKKAGFDAGTNVHPRDVVALKDGEHWLIEAKVVRRGNASYAVREAIGQLATYSYLLYPSEEQPRRMALFSEYIGDVYVRLLEHYGISAVWPEADGWRGSPGAVAAGLSEAPH